MSVATSSLRPGRSAMLGEALRCCETTPSVGIRIERPGVPAIAAAWLEEAANIGGGLVWRHGADGLWLLGGSAAPCRRAQELLQGMGWAADWLEFPRDLSRVETALAAEPALPVQPVSAAGLEARAAALPAEAGHTLATLWRMGGAAPRLLAQRWMADPATLPVPPGADWAGHAAALLTARLLACAGRGQWPMQRKSNLPLLLDLPWMEPPALLPAPPAGSGHALVLPLAGLPEAAAWAGLAARTGWGLAWSGLSPCLSHLLGSLPGVYVFAAPGEATGFPPSDRLILSGLADRTALAQALAAGYGLCSPLGE